MFYNFTKMTEKSTKMDKFRLDTLKVSEYKNYPFFINGEQINNFKKTGQDSFFGFVANCINGFGFDHSFWSALREAKQNDPKRYKHIKSFLPAYTLSAHYKEKRKKETMIEYNSLITIDIDPENNPQITDWAMIRDSFFNAWEEVVLSALSASGKGVFMVIALTENDHTKHKDYYETISKAFDTYGIKTDTSCKDVGRLRFATFDPECKYRSILKKEFTLPPAPPPPQKKPKKNYKPKPGQKYDPYSHAVNAANKKWGTFSDGNKHDWINTATWVMKQNGVPPHERKAFINNNYIDESEITTNCMQ